MVARKKKQQDTTKIVHHLVPEHEIIGNDEKKELLEVYKITAQELPKITISDPGIRHLNPKTGDIVRIKRPSASAGESIFYRQVIAE